MRYAGYGRAFTAFIIFALPIRRSRPGYHCRSNRSADRPLLPLPHILRTFNTPFRDSASPRFPLRPRFALRYSSLCVYPPRPGFFYSILAGDSISGQFIYLLIIAVRSIRFTAFLPLHIICYSGLSHSGFQAIRAADPHSGHSHRAPTTTAVYSTSSAPPTSIPASASGLRALGHRLLAGRAGSAFAGRCRITAGPGFRAGHPGAGRRRLARHCQFRVTPPGNNDNNCRPSAGSLQAASSIPGTGRFPIAGRLRH